MGKKWINTILLLLCTIVVAGAGHFTTTVKQPEKLKQIESIVRLAEVQRAQVAELLVKEASTAELAEDQLRKWKARYKLVPAELNTAEMVLYLESLTARGFEQFDINLQGVNRDRDLAYYTFKVTAIARFNALYEFIWHIENNREFYRIEDLKLKYQAVYKQNSSTNLPRRLDMVHVSFDLKAFFEGKNGITAGEEELMPIVAKYLPPRRARHNSFYPIVRTDLPPNDQRLVDIESADLISIVGQHAVFEYDGNQHVLAEGDDIYLGKIERVDPMLAQIRVSINKGGKISVVDIPLRVGERYRQAQGSDVRVRPID